MGFYFHPSSKVINGQLCFALQGTSSSGRLKGKIGEITITKPREISALLSGGAFWLEPDGTKVRLSLKTQ